MDLARHLRSWGADGLSRLLEARPDLLPATDRGLDMVARKAASPTSLGRALVGADVGMLVVAEALVASQPATVEELDDLLGTGDPIGVLEAVERLQTQAIVVVDDGLIHGVGALADLLHRPLGLGPSFAELADQLPASCLQRLAADTRADGGSRSATARAVARRLREPATIERLLADAPDGVADLFAELAAARSPAVPLPTAYPYRELALDDPLGWLLDRGLLVAVSDRGAELPREPAIAAHPDGLAPGAALRAPELTPVTGLSGDLVAGQAADRANRSLDGAESLLRLAGRGEISVRRVGGIGPRELGRLAKLTGLVADETARLIELLAATRLIAVEGNALVATELSGRWWSLDRHRRYQSLVRAWIGSDQFLSRGLAGPGQTGPSALGSIEPVAATAAARAVVIDTMDTIEPGQAWVPELLAASVVWQAPNLWGPGHPPPEQLVAWTEAEAELLGLSAEHAPSPVLRALRPGDDDAFDAAAIAAVGHDQDTVVLQPDLTALSLGPLAPSVARPLAEMTERLVDGDQQAPAFRFTETSVRRAYDMGWTAEAIVAFLTDHALAGIPQPLQYLLDDVARRHGTVRVQAAASVIVTDEDVLAVEIAANRRTSPLGLRLIAPTVLTSPLDPVAVVEGLRRAGFLPVLQGDTVTVDAGADDGTAQGGGDLPADWIAPPLPLGPFPDEVADAVSGLLDDPPPGGGTPPDRAPRAPEPGIVDALAALWGRPVRLRATPAAGGDVTGVIVGLGDAVALLTPSGVVEVPSSAVRSVDRLDRL